MGKRSAGILVYRMDDNQRAEVLLVHPGGPFFIRRDDGFWTVPKGEIEENEEAFEVALREFYEETGNMLPAHLEYVKLGEVMTKSRKTVTVWGVKYDFERPFIHSNLFRLEWPPKSGEMQLFPEADKAGWFNLESARKKIYPFQLPIINQLETMLTANK